MMNFSAEVFCMIWEYSVALFLLAGLIGEWCAHLQLERVAETVDVVAASNERQRIADSICASVDAHLMAIGEELTLCHDHGTDSQQLSCDVESMEKSIARARSLTAAMTNDIRSALSAMRI